MAQPAEPRAFDLDEEAVLLNTLDTAVDLLAFSEIGKCKLRAVVTLEVARSEGQLNLLLLRVDTGAGRSVNILLTYTMSMNDVPQDTAFDQLVGGKSALPVLDILDNT